MFVVSLCSAFTLAALVIVLARHRVSPRGRIAAGIFLLFMIGVDAWVVHVLRTDPDAWIRETCGWVEGKRGWRQVCL
ncbi:MAG: hypothetical protein WDN01_08980 [Rhizomicrobium sp.]